MAAEVLAFDYRVRPQPAVGCSVGGMRTPHHPAKSGKNLSFGTHLSSRDLNKGSGTHVHINSAPFSLTQAACRAHHLASSSGGHCSCSPRLPPHGSGRAAPSGLGGIAGRGAERAAAVGSRASGNLFSRAREPGACAGPWLVTRGEWGRADGPGAASWGPGEARPCGRPVEELRLTGPG